MEKSMCTLLEVWYLMCVVSAGIPQAENHVKKIPLKWISFGNDTAHPVILDGLYHFQVVSTGVVHVYMH